MFRTKLMKTILAEVNDTLEEKLKKHTNLDSGAQVPQPALKTLDKYFPENKSEIDRLRGLVGVGLRVSINGNRHRDAAKKNIQSITNDYVHHNPSQNHQGFQALPIYQSFVPAQTLPAPENFITSQSYVSHYSNDNVPDKTPQTPELPFDNANYNQPHSHPTLPSTLTNHGQNPWPQHGLSTSASGNSATDQIPVNIEHSVKSDSPLLKSEKIDAPEIPNFEQFNQAIKDFKAAGANRDALDYAGRCLLNGCTKNFSSYQTCQLFFTMSEIADDLKEDHLQMIYRRIGFGLTNSPRSAAIHGELEKLMDKKSDFKFLTKTNQNVADFAFNSIHKPNYNVYWGRIEELPLSGARQHR